MPGLLAVHDNDQAGYPDGKPEPQHLCRTKGEKMRYWLDTEFDERDGLIHLISIALVAEDGREYYAVNADYRQDLASPWLRENVLPALVGQASLPRAQIRSAVLSFLDPAPSEIWAYFGEYDWIVLRQLIGHMTDWPATWPLSHMNLAQWRDQSGLTLPPQDPVGLHHALYDARWCRDAWRHLVRQTA